MRVGERLTKSHSGDDLSWPIRRAATLFGTALAVVDGERRLSYGDLGARIASLAGALADGPVPEGGRVGFLGLNSLAHLECWFAVPAAGRVLVDMNLRLASSELEFIINDCGVQLLVVDSGRLDVGRLLRDRCPTLTDLVLEGEYCGADDLQPYEQLFSPEPAQCRHIDRDKLAGICYTGGTTGTPKGVMLSHGNLLANAHATT